MAQPFGISSESTVDQGRREFVLLALLGAALLVRLVWIVYTDFTQEDAFITYRFARNIASGEGFVYNAGEPIYGTTTPLFTLLMAAWHVIPGSEPVAGARLLGLAAALGGLATIWGVLGMLGAGGSGKILAVALLSLTPKLVFMDTGGMETPLILFFMAACLYALLRGRPILGGVLAGLLLWTRFDMALWPFSLALVVALRDRRQAAAFTLAAGLTYVPWLIFATLYFGSPLPHTVLAKWVAHTKFQTSPLTQHLSFFTQYLSPFYVPRGNTAISLLLALATLAGGGVFVLRRGHPTSLYAFPLFIVLEAARLSFTRATVAGRYFVPSLWAVLILLGLSLGALWDRRHSLSQDVRLPAAGAAVLAFLAVLGLGVIRAGELRVGQSVRHERSLKAVGLWLEANSPQDAVVLLEPLGYIGYYSDRTMIDEVGLVTPSVVALEWDGLVDTFFFLPDFEPDYVILHCDDRLRWQAMDAVDGEFNAQYSLAESFNPMDFDPEAPPDDSTSGVLRRNSCYEIWQRSAGIEG